MSAISHATTPVTASPIAKQRPVRRHRVSRPPDGLVARHRAQAAVGVPTLAVEVRTRGGEVERDAQPPAGRETEFASLVGLLQLRDLCERCFLPRPKSLKASRHEAVKEQGAQIEEEGVEAVAVA